MSNLTPVARAYGALRSGSVRVARQVGETPIDPSAWERRDRFVRGGPTVARGDDQVKITPPIVVGDDAVWERLHKAFKKHDDPFIRAFYAAEIIRKLPARQRQRMTSEFWEQYPLLIPLFLLNIWAPHLEAFMDEAAKTGKAFWQTLVADFTGKSSAAAKVKKKDVQAWSSKPTGTPPAKRP